MGYQFAGFFASADRSMLQDARRAWPGCRTHGITAPFHGVGVAVPETALTYGEPEDAYARAIEMWHNIEMGLPAWSRRYPSTLFVFLHADCFGGICYKEWASKPLGLSQGMNGPYLSKFCAQWPK